MGAFCDDLDVSSDSDGDGGGFAYSAGDDSDEDQGRRHAGGHLGAPAAPEPEAPAAAARPEPPAPSAQAAAHEAELESLLRDAGDGWGALARACAPDSFTSARDIGACAARRWRVLVPPPRRAWPACRARREHCGLARAGALYFAAVDEPHGLASQARARRACAGRDSAPRSRGRRVTPRRPPPQARLLELLHSCGRRRVACPPPAPSCSPAALARPPKPAPSPAGPTTKHCTACCRSWCANSTGTRYSSHCCASSSTPRARAGACRRAAPSLARRPCLPARQAA